MSSYVEFSEENKKVWIYFINRLLHTFSEDTDIFLLGLIIQQIYEFSVWSVLPVKRKSFNKNDLHADEGSEQYCAMCTNLAILRGIATHKPFELCRNKNRITLLFDNPAFRRLLIYRFGEQSYMFDNLLETYKNCL